MSRKLVVAGSIALLVASGCGGGGSDKTKSATHAKASSTLSTAAYQQRVTAVLYALRPAGSKLVHAHSDHGVIESARKLQASWTQGAQTLAALNGPPAAKKLQNQIVAALRGGAADMGREL